MSRWFAFVATTAALQATPPTGAVEWDSHELPGTVPPRQIVLARFHTLAAAQAWAALPGINLWPRRARVLMPAIVTALAPFGVIAGDTSDDALEKIAGAWSHPGVWEHY